MPKVEAPYLKFRILRGRHEDKFGRYERGEIVVTQVNLDKMFNTRGVTPKFELLGPATEDEVQKLLKQAGEAEDEGPEQSEAPPPVDPGDGLDELTVPALLSLAAEHEVDMQGAHRKAEFVHRLRSANVKADQQ